MSVLIVRERSNDAIVIECIRLATLKSGRLGSTLQAAI
jgi:hypothetical protein